MRFSTTLQAILVVAGLASADLLRVEHTSDLQLVARQDNTQRCVAGRTCSQCFGQGNILCGRNNCFNPTANEQCCGDGTYCIGNDNSCCGALGAGQTGRDGTPLATAAPTATRATATRNAASATSSAPDLQASSWDCERSDSREQCCQRGGNDVHWCSGSVLFIKCYRPTQGELCCSNGLTCVGNDCCRRYNAVATSPDPAVATSASATGTSTGRSSSQTGGASSKKTGAEAIAMAAGLLGLALL